MKIIPENLLEAKIPNEVLQPYFSSIERELSCTKEELRKEEFDKYKTYLETFAQQCKSISVRMQIRINLVALKNKLFPQGNPIPVHRKFPRKHHEFSYELFDNENEAYVV